MVVFPFSLVFGGALHIIIHVLVDQQMVRVGVSGGQKDAFNAS